MAIPRKGVHRRALEVTIKSDACLADPAHAGLLALARSLADTLDSQGDNPESRVTATYSGQLHSIWRVIREARIERQKSAIRISGPASRLGLIQAQAAQAAQPQKESA
jgi:hypothetical protein